MNQLPKKEKLLDEQLVKFVDISKNYDLTSFHCGEKEMDNYLINEALDDCEKRLSKTCLVFLEDELVGYYTTTSDLIEIDKKICRNCGLEQTEWPAVKIARLAISEKHQGIGLGTLVLKHVITDLYILSEKIGFRFVTLDAYRKRLVWYEKRNFLKNETYSGGSIVSLRFDLLSLKNLEE